MAILTQKTTRKHCRWKWLFIISAYIGIVQTLHELQLQNPMMCYNTQHNILQGCSSYLSNCPLTRKVDHQLNEDYHNIYFSKDSTSFITFSSLSKNAPNSSESTSGMAPALLGAAAITGAASSAGDPEMADLILKMMKRPKYPPRMAAATVVFFFIINFSVHN